ncbi:MAG: hypothetical protein IPL46_20025 [Saprospiraceae bacterium]|nr:hypothetical protein [Saprospiraceae bacterium]
MAFDQNNDTGTKFLMSIFDGISSTFVYSTLLYGFEPKFIRADSLNRIHLAGSGQWIDLVNPIANVGNQYVLTIMPFDKSVLFSSFVPCEDCEIENFALGLNNHMFFSATTQNESVQTTERLFEFTLGESDIYLGEIDIEKSKLTFATNIGGRGTDLAGGGLIVNKNLTKLYVAGQTRSNDYYTSPDGHTLHAPGNGDVIFTILELSGIDTSLLIFDANPQFIDDGPSIGKVDNIRDIKKVSDLVNQVRIGRRLVTADGASEVLLKIPSAESAITADWKIEKEYGKLETPWGSGTLEIENEIFFLAIYIPPRQLPKGEQVTLVDGIALTKTKFNIEYVKGDGKKRKSSSLP